MKKRLFAAATLITMAVACPAGAAPTLQVNSGSGQRAISLGYGQPLGQTFTAAGAGLTSFGFELAGLNSTAANLPVTLTIRSGDGTGGAAIAATTLTPSGLPTSYGALGWLDFGITATLTPGQTYSAVLTSSSTLFGLVYGPDVNIYTGAALGTDAYAGGHFFSNLAPDAICASGICDANFRYTIAAAVTSAVPEAATWAMMTVGLGVVGSSLRRRRSIARRIVFA